ncbi:hypothetical protein BC938DRAFT_471400, partial [Jimgerdemannia flammicorona]
DPQCEGVTRKGGQEVEANVPATGENGATEKTDYDGYDERQRLVGTAIDHADVGDVAKDPEADYMGRGWRVSNGNRHARIGIGIGSEAEVDATDNGQDGEDDAMGVDVERAGGGIGGIACDKFDGQCVDDGHEEVEHEDPIGGSPGGYWQDGELPSMTLWALFPWELLNVINAKPLLQIQSHSNHARNHRQDNVPQVRKRPDHPIPSTASLRYMAASAPRPGVLHLHVGHGDFNSVGAKEDDAGWERVRQLTLLTPRSVGAKIRQIQRAKGMQIMDTAKFSLLDVHGLEF